MPRSKEARTTHSAPRGKDAGKRAKATPRPRTKEVRALEAQRRYRLIVEIAHAGSVFIPEYAHTKRLKLSVALGDARALRDLKLAAINRGYIRRLFNFGGHTSGHSSVAARLRQRPNAKRRVANEIVADMAKLQERASTFTVLIAHGATAYCVAQALARRRLNESVTVMTTSLLVADVLSNRIPTVVSGGRYIEEEGAFFGHECVDTLSGYKPDVSVTSFSHMDEETGSLFTTDDREVPTLEACLSCPSRRIYLACDTLGRVGTRNEGTRFGCVKEMCKAKEVYLVYGCPPRPCGDEEHARDSLRKLERALAPKLRLREVRVS